MALVSLVLSLNIVSYRGVINPSTHLLVIGVICYMYKLYPFVVSINHYDKVSVVVEN